MINFQGQDYYDDRLFVLYLCKGTVDQSSDLINIMIYHDNPPEEHIWCVVTYRNFGRYPLFRVDCFYKKENAEDCIRLIEPQTPLISYGGRIPIPVPMYEDYIDWKKNSGLRDYEWQGLYSKNGANARENIMQTKEQFLGIK